MNISEYIVDAYNGDVAITLSVIIAAGCSIGLFILLVLHYLYLQRTQGNIISIRKCNLIIRILVTIEMFILLPLIYFKVSLGPPFLLHVVTDYGNGDSWIYGYGRPVSGIILIGLGIFSDMHYIIRYLTSIGCIFEVIWDCISIIQVHSYQVQAQLYSAPVGKYNQLIYTIYVFRDLISIGFSLLLIFHYIWMSYFLGFGRQNIPFHIIEGGNLDRVEIMQEQLLRSKYR